MTNPVADPATLDDPDLKAEAAKTIRVLLMVLSTQSPSADVLRRRVAALEAEIVTRAKRQEVWNRWTFGHRAIVLTKWHAEDLARAAGTDTSRPIWRPGHIGRRTVAEALGGPPPQPFTTPESGGPAPPGFGL
jgi:hypothetical protein